VFAKALLKNFSMYLQCKLENPELMDLLVTHTNRFVQIMIHGETYAGEYKVCKRTIELIQNEIFSRQPYYLKPSFSRGKFDNSSVQH
jgi:hypothetical protein